MSMLDYQMIESALSAISYRLNSVEEKVKKYEKITEVRENMGEDPFKDGRMATILASRLTPLCNKVAQIEAKMGLKSSLEVKLPTIPQIEVPVDLRMIPGKGGKKKNRTAEVVQMRWKVWKMQHESGIPMNAIARAWKCDHGSICYAKKQGWIVGDNKRSVPYQRKSSK